MRSIHPCRRAAFCTASLAVAALGGTAHAAEFDPRRLGQAEFRAFSEDIGSAVSYKPMIPSEGLGIPGFDLGLSASGTSVAHQDVLVKAAGGASVSDTLAQVGLRAVKGLPWHVDVGIVATSLPETNLRAFGGEVRWAFIGGDTVMPAVALRLSTMNVQGVDTLKMRTNGIDLSLSKGFAFVTPYAGVGYVDIRSSAPGTNLAEEHFGVEKVFAGVNVAFVPFALLFEADRTGDTSSFGVKFAMRW